MVAFSAPGHVADPPGARREGARTGADQNLPAGLPTHRRTDRDQQVAEGVDDLHPEAVGDLGFQPSEDRRVRARPADPYCREGPRRREREHLRDGLGDAVEVLLAEQCLWPGHREAQNGVDRGGGPQAVQPRQAPTVGNVEPTGTRPPQELRRPGEAFPNLCLGKHLQPLDYFDFEVSPVRHWRLTCPLQIGSPLFHNRRAGAACARRNEESYSCSTRRDLPGGFREGSRRRLAWHRTSL